MLSDYHPSQETSTPQPYRSPPQTLPDCADSLACVLLWGCSCAPAQWVSRAPLWHPILPHAGAPSLSADPRCGKGTCSAPWSRQGTLGAGCLRCGTARRGGGGMRPGSIRPAREGAACMFLGRGRRQRRGRTRGVLSRALLRDRDWVFRRGAGAEGTVWTYGLGGEELRVCIAGKESGLAFDHPMIRSSLHYCPFAVAYDWDLPLLRRARVQFLGASTGRYMLLPSNRAPL